MLQRLGFLASETFLNESRQPADAPHTTNPMVWITLPPSILVVASGVDLTSIFIFFFRLVHNALFMHEQDFFQRHHVSYLDRVRWDVMWEEFEIEDRLEKLSKKELAKEVSFEPRFPCFSFQSKPTLRLVVCGVFFPRRSGL